MKHILILLLLPAMLFLQQCADQPAEVNEPAPASDTLLATIDSIAKEYDARIGVAFCALDSGQVLSYHGKEKFTMMSVVKFPQALAMLSLADRKLVDLNALLQFTKEDMQRQTYSPMRDSLKGKPSALTMRETITYAVGSSDNLACDKLFTLFSPHEVDSFFHGLRYTDMGIGTNYADITDSTISKNWSTPECMAQVLADFANGSMLSDSSTQFLLKVMTETTNPANRLKGQLPATAVVAHKTGTMSVIDSVIPAFNDVGIVTLPNGKRYAIAVFVNDSKEDEATSAEAIARISLAVWNYFEQQ